VNIIAVFGDPDVIRNLLYLCFSLFCYLVSCHTLVLVQEVLPYIEKDDLFRNVNYESGKANFCKQEEVIMLYNSNIKETYF
jgi:hypothetical protein